MSSVTPGELSFPEVWSMCYLRKKRLKQENLRSGGHVGEGGEGRSGRRGEIIL